MLIPFDVSPPPAVVRPAQPSAQQNQALPQITPADLDSAIRTVWGEARGEGPLGQQAVAGVILNRALASGRSIAHLVKQRHQFAGFNTAARALDTASAAYQSIKQAIEPVLLGLIVNPVGTADHFYAPAAMPNGSKPAWDDGSGQLIGAHEFFTVGFAGHAPNAQGSKAPDLVAAAWSNTKRYGVAMGQPAMSMSGLSRDAAPPAANAASVGGSL